MKKYIAGGRCGGSTTVNRNENISNSTNSAYNLLVSQREQQESLWISPQSEIAKKIETQIQTQTNNPITTLTIQSQVKKQTKKDDIDLILQGDI